jgi:hypothetical protein
VTEQMFIIAAKALAEQVTDENLSTGLIYPPQSPEFSTLRFMWPAGSPNISSIRDLPGCRGRMILPR